MAYSVSPPPPKKNALSFVSSSPFPPLPPQQAIPSPHHPDSCLPHSYSYLSSFLLSFCCTALIFLSRLIVIPTFFTFLLLLTGLMCELLWSDPQQEVQYSKCNGNPFTPKSDQYQISPAASPEILHNPV